KARAVAGGPMESVPVLNRFVLRAGGKGPESTYADCAAALSALPLADEKQRDGLEKQMCRLAQHGALTLGTVELALGVLPKGSRGDKGDRLLARFVLYLVQLALGDGSAGTPVPQPAGRGSAPSPPRAVDALGPEQLCPAWSALGGEEAVPFLRKQAALRALAALASAARTSRPDDPTYPDGLYSTLTSLLARLRELRASRSSLGSLLAAQRAAEGSALARQKHAGQEFKKVMEQWGLMRLAFSAARCALSPPASLQVAASCFAGVSSPDSLGARHALALAALAALEPQAVMVVVAELGPRLAQNLALARITGTCGQGCTWPAQQPPACSQAEWQATWPAALGEATRCHPTPPHPTPPHPTPPHPPPHPTPPHPTPPHPTPPHPTPPHPTPPHPTLLAVWLWLVSGAVWWEALVLLALGEAQPLVALEAVRAMFGAAPPQPGPGLQQRGHGSGAAPGSDRGPLMGASWRMVISMADSTPDLPDTAPPGPGNSPSSLFTRLSSRLLAALQSPSRAMRVSACHTAGVMFESRAWCSALSGGFTGESGAVQKAVRGLVLAVQAGGA
ncbi:hypothetical protein QJQ45_029699, partial [Haematococcus lacustris]